MMIKASDNKKTILHVIDALNVGGAQELLVLLSEKTPVSDYRSIVCSIQSDRTIKDRIESKGVPVFCLNRIRPGIHDFFNFISYFWYNVKDIISICRKHKVQVVHCHLSDAEFTGIMAGWLYRADRIISTVHYPALLPERKSWDFRNHLRIAATRILYNLTDAVVAVSDDVAEKLQAIFGIPSSKIKIIVNGIDVEAIHGTLPKSETLASVFAMPQDRIVTSIGRLTAPKGHSYLVEAIPDVICNGNLKLILAGDGELRDNLEKICRNIGIKDNVSFLGSRNDVADILAISEVFVLPSISEGTSLALLEAMAAAKPIVATDIPGNTAILKHRFNCLLVPPENPAKLAEAISFLLNSPETATEYGNNAYHDVKKYFNIDQTVIKLTAIWN